MWWANNLFLAAKNFASQIPAAEIYIKQKKHPQRLAVVKADELTESEDLP